MMRVFMKRTLALLLALMLPLTALADVTDDYLAAQRLLAESRFAEAAEAFGALGSYEEASLLAMYCRACALCESGDYDTGIAVLTSMGDYKDCAWRTTYYQARALEAKAGAADWATMSDAMAVYGRLPLFLDSAERIAALDGRVAAAKAAEYDAAVAAGEAGQYDTAIASFRHLEAYQDSASRVIYYQARKLETLAGTSDWEVMYEARGVYETIPLFLDSAERIAALDGRIIAAKDAEYDAAVAAAAAGQTDSASEAFLHLGDYRDAAERLASLLKSPVDAARAHAQRIAAGDAYVAGLWADGTVAAVGRNTWNQCNVSGWTDVVAIAAYYDHTVGLRADGTVVATGTNSDGQCRVSGWTDVVAVAAGAYFTVGLRADGTVTAVGRNKEGQCNVSGWKDVVAIAAGGYHTVVIRADGSVSSVGSNRKGQRNLNGWDGVIAVAAGLDHTVGLRADGTVVAAGDTGDGRCSVGSWTDIVAIAAGSSHTVGLRADGTVVAVGSNGSGQCNVSKWTDIVAIVAGHSLTVGLRADGTVVVAGRASGVQLDVSAWDLMD